MTRAPLRNVLKVALIAAPLCLTARSPAAARPLHTARATAPATWIATWTTWVERLVLGTAPPRARATSTAPSLPALTAHPMTGSCVDPNGHPVPCIPS